MTKLTKAQERWLTALESGEYKQTRDLLRDDNGFCCLGVACDLSGLGEWTLNLNLTHMFADGRQQAERDYICLLYTSPSPRDRTRSRMPSSA